MKKLLKLVLAFAIAVVPLLTAIPAAANAEGQNTPITTFGLGTPDSPAQAAITKLLQMPDGTTVPSDAGFQFTVDYRATLTGGGLNAAPINVPASPASLTIGNTPLTDAGRAHFGPFANDVAVYAATTTDLLAGINWIAPGQFLFTVREVANTNANIMPFEPGYVEDMFYDDTFFTLLVRVAADENGDLYVQYTAAWEGNGPFGDGANVTDVPEGNQEGKLEPDPGRPGGPGNLEGYSDIAFLNTFVRRTEDDGRTPSGTPGGPGEQPELPGGNLPGETPGVPGPGEQTPGTPTPEPVVPGFDTAFMVTKNVDGQTASAESVFDFTAQVTLPSLVSNAPITAWIYTFDGNMFVQGAQVYFTNGSANFQLGHNQSLVFGPLPIGTTVVATELPNELGYVPTVHLILGGDGIGQATGTAATGVSTDNVPTAPHRLGEGLNHAGFINSNIEVPITGLLLNNLPIILIGVGVIGFAAMTIASQKRRAYQ